MKQYFFLFLCFIFFAANAIAQKKAQFSVEAGASFSKFPIFYSKKFSKTRDLPLLSPVLGVASHLKLNKRLSLSVGLQYQQRGSVVSETSEGTDLASGSFSSKFYAQSRFHEIAIPATLTGHFNLKAFKFNAILGFQRLWNLGGYYTLSSVQTANNVQTFRKELLGSPFDDSIFRSNNLRSFNQITFGLSFPIKSNFELMTILHYSPLGYGIEEKPIGQIPGLDYHNYFHFVNCSDFQLVCRYYLN
jgi:hypothetical protein